MNVQLSVGHLFQIKLWMRSRKFCFVLLGITLAAGFTAHAASGGIEAAATQTTLKVSTDNSGMGTKATFVAHISVSNGGEPTGVVRFQSAANDLGSAAVDADGNASLSTGSLSAGSHQVVAVYQGDASHASSISPSAQVDATPSTVAGFTVSASPSSLSIPVGSFGTSVMTLTPVNGFSAYISLACNGLPAGATCVFSPSYLQASCTTGSGGVQTCPSVLSTMQIQTYAPSTSLSSKNEVPGGKLPKYAVIFPALLSLAGLGAHKKRALWNVVLVFALLSGALCLTACNVRYNYLNHGPTPNTGTQTGTYTVTIDAVSTTGSIITKPVTPVQVVVTISGASGTS